MGSDGKLKRNPFQTLSRWVRRQSVRVKTALGVAAAIATLFFLRLVVYDHDKLFVAAECFHFLGISVLTYKLTNESTCAGLSLKSQILTALFLAVRLYCSFVMEYDIHTVLDSLTLITTLWVVYMMQYKLRSSYMEDKDTVPVSYVVIPCFVLALLICPMTTHLFVNRIAWAFSVYLEAVSVLPQLRLMQNIKIVEPFTAHYVFALGVSRFLSCGHWILQLIDSRGQILLALAYGLGTNDSRGHLLVALAYGLWPAMVILAEAVQTFILADFCYYYVKSVVGGNLVMRLPSGAV